MAAPTSWRDRIKVHPAANMFPMMSKDELQALAKDIAENGLRHGVVLWTPQSIQTASRRKLPSDLYLLDGRNRLEALELSIADEEEREEAIGLALYPSSTDPDAATLLYGDVEPFTFVISANIHRRHLTAAQKNELIVKLKAASPELSTRAIAAATGMSQTTIQRALSAPPSGEPNGSPAPSPERVAGRDGKSYPAQQPARKKAAAPVEKTPSTPPSQSRDKAIEGVSMLLQRDLANALDDLARLLKGYDGRIAQIPKHKRIAMARAYLDALGVKVADLDERSEAA
jgi:hypothetical protein